MLIAGEQSNCHKKDNFCCPLLVFPLPPLRRNFWHWRRGQKFCAKNPPPHFFFPTFFFFFSYGVSSPSSGRRRGGNCYGPNKLSFLPSFPPGFMARPLFMGAILLKAAEREEGEMKTEKKKFGEGNFSFSACGFWNEEGSEKPWCLLLSGIRCEFRPGGKGKESAHRPPLSLTRKL